jgi:DnaJ-class molecular chaperone
MLQASDEFWADEHETFVEQAAQDTKESAQHIPQHSNGAEPTEICPTCKGDGIARDGGYPYNGRCGLCGGSGKLRHC